MSSSASMNLTEPSVRSTSMKASSRVAASRRVHSSRALRILLRSVADGQRLRLGRRLLHGLLGAFPHTFATLDATVVVDDGIAVSILRNSSDRARLDQRTDMIVGTNISIYLYHRFSEITFSRTPACCTPTECHTGVPFLNRMRVGIDCTRYLAASS